MSDFEKRKEEYLERLSTNTQYVKSLTEKKDDFKYTYHQTLTLASIADARSINCFSSILESFNEEKDGDAYLFRIGDPDKYADTETHYEYTYIYDTRGDHFKGGDEERSRILEERLAMYKEIHNICGYMWFSLNDYRTHCGEEGENKLRRRVHGSTDLYGNEKPSYRLLCRLQNQ